MDVDSGFDYTPHAVEWAQEAPGLGAGQPTHCASASATPPDSGLADDVVVEIL